MIRPTRLHDFVAPPRGRTGWPWTPGSAGTQSDGSNWPRITVITPSYNQASFLEETIRSVVLQGYPNLEYIVLDGGSMDGSLQILEKYGPYLDHWESAPDNGQADAIFRGLKMATGEVVAWLNSDDFYLPGTLHHIATKFRKNPTSDLIVGGYLAVGPESRLICKHYVHPQSFQSLLASRMLFGQMSCFWKRDAFFEVGGFDRDLRFCFDYDLFLRLTKRENFMSTGRMLAACRFHNATKSATIWEDVGRREMKTLQERHGIDRLSSETISRLRRSTERAHKWCALRGLLSDCFVDPEYVVRHVGSRIRDRLLLGLGDSK